MTRTERINEMMDGMKSFRKGAYMKAELLDEMLALQTEIVELAFNREHASSGDLRIWDVEEHLAQMNREYGNVADLELQAFERGSKILCNLIKAEISGKKGEAKAFRFLQDLKNKNIILKNIELSDGDYRAELDAIVITPETIVIVEVKNTGRDIFIDNNGDYYKTGEYLKLDCNIANKMQMKERLLRKALEQNGINNIQLKSLLVFTDNRIEVHNVNSSVKTCFASQLASLIDGFAGDNVMTDTEMVLAEKAIRESECKNAYSFDFDVERYKSDFATLMAVLEEASSMNNVVAQDVNLIDEKEACIPQENPSVTAKATAEKQVFEKEASVNEEDVIRDKRESRWTRFKKKFRSNYGRYASGLATGAILTGTILTGAVTTGLIAASTLAILSNTKGGIVK